MIALYLVDHSTAPFEELARVNNLDVETLRSYHRNSYRAIHAESASDPLKGRWDYAEGHQVYEMDDIIRDEILRLTSLD